MTTMTLKSARAYLIAQRRITDAVAACLKALTPEERDYAESYWAAHIAMSLNGTSWGSMPTQQAASIVDLNGEGAQ